MSDFKTFLSKDKRLKPLLNLEISYPKRSTNLTMSLVGSILSQQLSTHVAKVMHARFLALFDGKKPSANGILKIPVSKIREIGISQRKAEYIHHVAQFIVEHKITITKLDKMSDEEVIDLLSQIKGVGRWTVEMLLIFGLGREDVFAVDDLGIQKGMIQLFKLHDLEKAELRLKMMELSKRWSPYRSYVCLYLWKWGDSVK